jgi:uncharacterized protein (DUF2141 family)
MKQLIYILVILILLIDPAAGQGRIQVSVTNFRSDKGVCRLCLFDSPEAYKSKKQQPVNCLSLQVKNKKATGTFENVPSGTYAIFGFHDANDNNVMDNNFIGVPTEGYGASMNKLPFASAPGYEENKFTVDGKSTMVLKIRLRNL